MGRCQGEQRQDRRASPRSQSEARERVGGRPGGADRAQRRAREQELVAPFLGAGAPGKIDPAEVASAYPAGCRFDGHPFDYGERGGSELLGPHTTRRLRAQITDRT